MELDENDDEKPGTSMATATTVAPAGSSESKAAKNARISENAIERQLPTAVVAPELTERGVSLRGAWVATLREKRDISTTVRAVSKILPGVSYLKRCSGKRMLLAFAAPDETRRVPGRHYAGRQELEDYLTDNHFDLSVFDKEFELVRVPAGPQMTKAQASAASKAWPINFHPDISIERILSGRWFDDEDLERIERCMRACVEAAAREAHGDQECNGSAVAFDPIGRKIVAVSASRIDRHPMWHATILAIDLVARNGGEGAAGAYELTDEKNARETRKRAAHAMNHRDEQILAYPRNLVDIVHRYATESPASGKSSATGYLCTDYWIFLLREPCPLCAMALVHSRASNVFYGIPNEHRGLLGSRALLHTTPGLNHRYRVWRGVCEKECRETFNEISLRSCSFSTRS